MKFIDLFCGIGGLSAGFLKHGFDLVYANDNDSDIVESFSKNHPTVDIDNRDIRDINIKKIFKSPSHVDLVVGGPPCQGYSQKGKRSYLRGIHEGRN